MSIFGNKSDAGFWKTFIIKANEHSKKLTIIDTIIYVILMIGLLVVMIIRSDIAENCVNAMGHTTTAFIAVRATYGVKAGLENWRKCALPISDGEEDQG